MADLLEPQTEHDNAKCTLRKEAAKIASEHGIDVEYYGFLVIMRFQSTIVRVCLKHGHGEYESFTVEIESVCATHIVVDTTYYERVRFKDAELDERVNSLVFNATRTAAWSAPGVVDTLIKHAMTCAVFAAKVASLLPPPIAKPADAA